MDDYVGLVLERDVEELSRIRLAEALPRLLARLAGQTAQVLNMAKVAEACELENTTAHGYLRLLEAVFLIHKLPAWGRNLRSRSSKRPKVHVTDSGVAARLMRVSPEKLARKDEAALADLGHLLETFVVGEILKQASWMDRVTGTGHWRTHDGDEVDLVIELDDGRILGFEVKASARANDATLRPMRKLRDAAGESFAGGVVLNLGEHSTVTRDGIRVMPVDQLWA
ncbi:MAG TPA: DUF4143 domain-containing protein [Solirubrobacterales bacterium]|nr:DUF4143 domain-containing protein [Solirubrobacterales bacterium]